MTESSIDDRLAALQARGRTSRVKRDEQPAPAVTTDIRQHRRSRVSPIDETKTFDWGGGILADSGLDEGPADVVAFSESIARNRWRPELNWRNGALRPSWSGSRVAAAGASVVSFASMVVAMGPLLASNEGTPIETGSATDESSGSDAPVAPSTGIETSPLAAAAAPAAEVVPGETESLLPAPADPTAGSLETETAADPPPVDQPAADDPAPATPSPEADPTPSPEPATGPDPSPATQPPASQAPAASPTTAAPTTAAPTTAAPTTAAPTTAAPTTAPPTTPAPTTAPPRSDGSG